jgi:streptogramin lyase
MKRLVLAAMLSGLLLAPTALAAPAVTGEFDLGEVPQYLTLGPDGNMWVALEGSDIARVAPDGTVKTFTVPEINTPKGITTGPDANLWVTQINGVVRFSPADPENTGTKFEILLIGAPQAITAGPDGNLWTASQDNLFRITPAGVSTPFPITGMGARGITVGADGRLYVADFTGQRIVGVTTDGDPTFHPTGGGPQDVARGPAPGLPVAYTNPSDEVGFVNAAGDVQKVDVTGTDPTGLTLGDDGANWIANFPTSTLTRLAPDRTVTTLTGFSANSGPRRIATGTGGTLWVGLETAKKIARVSGVEAPPPPPEPQPQPVPQPPPQPVVDTAPPAVTRIGLARRIRRGRAPVVRFTLSEPAKVTVTVARRRGHRFVRVARKTVALAAGARRIKLRTLKLGRYRLSIVARDAAGNRAQPIVRSFRVVRR